MTTRRPKKKSWLDALDEDYATAIENAPDTSEETPAAVSLKLPLRFITGEAAPTPATPATAAAPSTPEYKKGFLENLLTSDNPTTGVGLATSNWFAANQEARAQGDYDVAAGQSRVPTEELELQRLQTQLGKLRDGSARKLSVSFGPGEMGTPYYTESEYTPEEVKGAEQSLLSQIAELQSRKDSGEFDKKRAALAAEADAAKLRADAAHARSLSLQERLGSGTARVSTVSGQTMTPSQILPVVSSLGAGTAAGALTLGNPAAIAGAGMAGAGLGSIPQARQLYYGSLNKAMLPPEQGGWGATYDEAQEYAATKALIEYGSESLSGAVEGLAVAGKVGAKALAARAMGSKAAGFAERALQQRIASRLARTTASVGTEYITEVASNAGDAAHDQLLASASNFGSEQGRKLRGEDVAARWSNFGNESLDTLIGVLGIAGAPSALGAHVNYTHDVEKAARERAAASINKNVSGLEARMQDRPRTNDIPVQPLAAQGDLFPEAQPQVDPAIAERQAALRKAQETVAWNQRNRERAAETQSTNERNGLVAQADNALSHVETLRDRVENGDTSSGTLNSLAAAQRDHRAASAELGRFDEQSASTQAEQTPTTEPQQLALGLDEPVQPERTGDSARPQSLHEREANAVLEAQKKRDELLLTREAERRNKERTAARTKALMDVADQNRHLPADQRVAAIAEAARQFDAANPEVTTDQLDLNELVVNRNKKSKKGWTPATTAPESTTTPPQTEQQTEQSMPPQTSDIGKRISELADKIGQPMAMEEDGTPAPSVPYDKPRFIRAVATIVHALTKNNSQAAVDVINLDQQDKLGFAPSPEHVGLSMSDKSVAAFDTNGKMWVFTDRVNPKDAVASIIRGYHEATHAGQLNEREGRTPVMQTLLGSAKYGDAVKRVLDAAQKGNIVAKRALAATNAQLGEDAATNNPELFNKELMGHFVGEVMRQRNTSLGSVAGVARDILSGAKQVTRKVLGQDVDVAFNDIYSAVKGVGQEVVKTDIKKGAGDTPLAMIYNVREGKPTPGQQRAIDNGYVYDSVAGTKKYVLSDSDAKIDTNGMHNLVNTLFTGVAAPLDSVLQHDVLYAERPEAKSDVTVMLTDTLPRHVRGQYRPNEKRIYIAKSVASSGAEAVRGVAMHELQHYVQDSDGRANQYFSEDPTGAVAKAKKKYDYADRQHTLAINSLISAVQREYMRSPISQEVADIVSDFNKSDTTKAAQLVDLLDKQGSVPSDIQNFVKDYKDTNAKLVEKTSAYNAELAKDYDLYKRNITEKEAFFTQKYRKADQATLDRMNPERVMRQQDRDPTTGVDTTEGKIDVPQNDGTVEAKNKAAPMAMEETDKPEQITKRYVPAWVRGLFDSSIGLSKETNEIIERAMDSPAGDRMRAEATMGEYDYHLSQMATEQGITANELNDKIGKELQAIPTDLKGYDANIAAFDAVVNKYGKAGEALKKMRSQIDDLSLTMIDNRMKSNIPLSDSEKKLYQTILNNLGRYNHRLYAAYTGKAGKKYAKTVLADYLKRKRAGEPLDPVTEANYQKVANAVKYLVDNSLNIPDDEGLGTMGADQANSLYSTWIGDPTNMSLEDVKQSLYNIREKINANKPLLEKRAEKITKQLLGLVDQGEPLAQYYRGSKLNTSILKKRTDIAPELRGLMGELTDPTMTMLMTTAKLAEFTSRTKMFLELADQMDGDLLPPGSDVPESWKPLTGEGYGPLENFYASPNLAAALADVQQVHATFEQAVAMAAHNPLELSKKLIIGASNAWAKAAKVSKVNQVVSNPANFIFNLGGGAMSMLQNGNFNPVHLGKAIRDAAQLISYATNPKSANPNITKLVENGVVDSAFIGEIKSEQYRELNNLIKRMSGHSDSEIVASVKDWLSSHAAAARETYAMMDVIFKIANFRQQEAMLRDFYAAEGKNKTDEQIIREAAGDVKRTNYTYRRAMPLAKAVERLGFTAFAPYMSEVFRTQVTNLMQGYGEIKRASEATTPEGKRIMATRGAKRIAGQMLTYGLVAQAARMFAKAAFGDDDDKENAQRSLLPDYLRDQDFYPVGTDADGYAVLLQMSRFDPAGPATDLIRAAVNGKDVSANDVLKKIYDVYVTPRIGGQAIGLIKAVVSDKSPGRVPLSQQVAPEAYSNMIDIANKFGIDTATVKAFTNLGEAMLPGFMSSWRDTNGRPVGDDPVSTAYRMASYMGFTFQTLNPTKPLRFAATDYKAASDSGARELAEYFKDNPDRSPIEVEAKLKRVQLNEREAFDHLTDVYSAARVLGVPQSTINQSLKEQRLTLAQLRAIAQGRYASSVVSRNSVQRYRDFELRDAEPADRPAIRLKWRAIERTLIEANANVTNGETD